MKKSIVRTLVALFCIGLPTLVSAQTTREDIHANLLKTGGNYYAYPDVRHPLTAAPKGYKPFYISHYARHGSRWLIDPGQYNRPVNVLTKAREQGKLSATGEKVLQVCDSVAKMAQGRYGELSPRGARQHRHIAQRMYENFPQVFAKNAPVDARSTVIIRCILSMMNECLQLQACEPTIQLKTDASAHDMYYMNNENQPDIQKYRNNPDIHEAHKQLNANRTKEKDIAPRLFNDLQYANDSIDAGGLISDLFAVASNMQSLDTDLDLYWLFSEQEAYDLWANYNMGWHINYSNSPLTKGKMPFLEADLLRNILDTADSCITQKKPGATLRFGHEVVVLPLASLMELGHYGQEFQDDATLEEHWRNYEVFPMACNIQLVFYRKAKSADILVKILLNEQEMTLPIKSDLAPYYHWTDVATFSRNKLAHFTTE